MLNICYMGSGPFAARVLELLVKDARFTIEMVVTQPHAPSGRKKTLTPTPVFSLAKTLGLQIFEAANSKQILEILKPETVDFLIVCDYGVLLKQPVIDLPRFETLNIHGSLLPKYRGASPIQAALRNGDSSTGISLQQMVLKLDAGPVFAEKTYFIDETSGFIKVRDDLAWLGAKLLLESLERIKNGDLLAKPQDESHVSFCSKIQKSEAQIDFKTMTALQIYNLYRAFEIWPKLFFNFSEHLITMHKLALSEKKLKPGEFLVENKSVYVGCQTGSLQILELQLAGKPVMLTATFLNGRSRFFENQN